MLNKKLICIVIAVCFICQCDSTQEYINLMDPDQEVSQEFKEYNKEYNKVFNSIGNGDKLPKAVVDDYFKFNTESYKKLLSLSFFATMQNPYIRSQIGPNFFEDYLLFNPENYQDFNFKYRKYYLYDLHWAPCVFVGKITQIDTIDLSHTSHRIAMDYFLKCEIQLSHNLNNYIKVDISNKRLKFILSPFSRSLRSGPSVSDKYQRIKYPYTEKAYVNTIPIELRKKPYLELNTDFLIFISPSRIQPLERYISGEELPHLYINSFGIECFPVIGDEIVNLCHYFGDSDTISIVDAKKLINSVLDEIKSWKE